MVRVLVAHADEAVCDAIAAALEVAVGHLMVTTSDGELSLATLWLSDRPMVAPIGDRLMPFSGIDILRVAANDPAEGELGRHRYILLTTDPGPTSLKSHSVRLRLGAPVVALPVELDTLIELIDEVVVQGDSEK